MPDWNKPLHVRGFAARVVGETVTGDKIVAVATTMQGHNVTNERVVLATSSGGRIHSTFQETSWEYVENKPPEDIVQYVVYAQHFSNEDEVVATTYDKPQLLDSTAVKYYGQTKIVIDPVTLKIKSTEVVK